MKKYMVKEQDTIRSIAEENGLSMEQLIRANRNLSNLHDPYPGTDVNIPDNTVQDYNLQEGLMFRLETMDNTYYFFNPHAEPVVKPQDKLERDLDEWSVKRIFQESIDSGLGMNKLYELYEPLNTGRYLYDNHPPDVDKMVDKVVDRTNGPHVITEYKFYYAEMQEDLEKEQKKENEEALRKAFLAQQAAAAEQNFTKVKFRVVDNQTGDPIPGVKVTTEMPDGSINDLESRPQGTVLTSTKKKGSFEVKTCNYNPADMNLDNAYHFVGISETPIGSSGKQALMATCLKDDFAEKENSDQSKKKHLVYINPHKNMEDNCLNKVAEYEDSKNKPISYDDLVHFNWGSRNEKDVEKEMKHDVGSDETADSGKLKIQENSPGNVYKPAEWKKKGLSTEKVHTLRVKKIKPGIRYHYEIGGIDYYESETGTKISPNVRDENIILWLDEENEPEESKWAYQVDLDLLKKMKEFVPGWVTLFFPLPPEDIRKSGKFSMVHSLDGEEQAYYIYEKVTFDTFYEDGPDYEDEPLLEG